MHLWPTKALYCSLQCLIFMSMDFLSLTNFKHLVNILIFFIFLFSIKLHHLSYFLFVLYIFLSLKVSTNIEYQKIFFNFHIKGLNDLD